MLCIKCLKQGIERDALARSSYCAEHQPPRSTRSVPKRVFRAGKSAHAKKAAKKSSL
jgi:hypothetical protein